MLGAQNKKNSPRWDSDYIIKLGKPSTFLTELATRAGQQSLKSAIQTLCIVVQKSHVTYLFLSFSRSEGGERRIQGREGGGRPCPLSPNAPPSPTERDVTLRRTHGQSSLENVIHR